MRRIGITMKTSFPEKQKTLDLITSILEKMGLSIFIDGKRKKDIETTKKYPTFKEGKEIDALLVIGGDGTILRAIRELGDFAVPIVSVNSGDVGFLAEVSISEAPTLLPKLLRGECVNEKRNLLNVRVMRGTKIIHQSCVLNEAVIAQGAIARILDLQTQINGEPLATFHADGLIIATPTGSTAYSLAAGGPIVHPQLRAMILTPLNPHSLTQKPIVIPGEHTVEIDVLKKENKFLDTGVSLTLDGQTYIALERHDRVSITISPSSVTFLRRKQDTFFSTLRTKLGWGERLE